MARDSRTVRLPALAILHLLECPLRFKPFGVASSILKPLADTRCQPGFRVDGTPLPPPSPRKGGHRAVNVEFAR
jgi:hypothetical protein